MNAQECFHEWVPAVGGEGPVSLLAATCSKCGAGAVRGKGDGEALLRIRLDEALRHKRPLVLTPPEAVEMRGLGYIEGEDFVESA